MAEHEREELRRAQRERLNQRAEQTGSVAGLLYHFAADRAWDSIQALGDRALPGPPEDQLLYRLLLHEHLETPLERLEELCSAAADPWLAHAFTKFLLGRDRAREALKVAQQQFNSSVPGVACLNLIAKYFLAAGQWDLAAELSNGSLQVAPHQRDMKIAARAAARKERLFGPLNLDVLPAPGKVTWYLPVYKVERHIRGAIEGVLSQTHPVGEILVVDDASPDASAAIAAEYPVRVLRHEENRGLAAARNTAFQYAAGEFVATVDTDAAPEPGYTQHALAEFENCPAELAGVGGRLIERYADPGPDQWRAVHLSQDRGALRYYVDAPDGRAEADTDEDRQFHATTAKQLFLFGANTLYRREAVLAAGGYDEALRTNAEDVFLCCALTAAGRHFAFTPHAVAWHDRRDTVQSVLRTSWNYNFAGRKQHGFYRSAHHVIEHWRFHLDLVRTRVDADLRNGRPACAFISFLHLFYDALLDLRYAVRASLMAQGVARAVGDRLTALADTMPGAEDALLARAVRTELQPLLDDIGPVPGAIPAELLPGVEAGLDRLRSYIALTTPELNALYCAGARELGLV